MSKISTEHFFPISVYFRKKKEELKKVFSEQGGKATFESGKKWTGASKLLEQAKATGQKLPILFSAADGYNDLIYWAVLESISVQPDAKGKFPTTLKIVDLTPLPEDIPLNSLRKVGTDQHFSDDMLSGYCFCQTPAFLQHQIHYWVIKGRPSDNDFESWLIPGTEDTWRTSRPPQSWSPGDRLFFWMSSPARCVVGLGVLKGLHKKKDKSGNNLFDVEYLTYPLANRPFIDDLRLNAKLFDASFLKSGPAWTVYSLTEEQGKELYQIVVGQNPEINLGWNTRTPLIQRAREFEAVDLAEPPARVITTTSRVIRDTVKARQMKLKYGYGCQVCRLKIEFGPGRFYVEAHHVRPLGGNHKGCDTEDNLMILCPTHHAMFDLGIPYFVSPNRIRIYNQEYDLLCNHKLSDDNVSYHNEFLYNGVLNSSRPN
ncbi:MAG: HNH endonuclease [Acidobacteria bacterium]|nr:HNH endonuclease [Acidobacteriota bacterium]MBI3427830.1 HNH endonuclease [Acidobacteriota bacterium]